MEIIMEEVLVWHLWCVCALHTNVVNENDIPYNTWGKILCPHGYTV